MTRLKQLLAKQRRKRAAAAKRLGSLTARRKALTLKLTRRPQLAHYVADRFNLRFTSGWRSVQHNRDVGGVPNSWHTKGNRRKPGASDWVGSLENMKQAEAWLRGNVPHLSEVLIHNVGSGLHLHAGGMGVINFSDPRRKELGRVRAEIQRQLKRSAAASKRIKTLTRALTLLDRRQAQIEAARKAGVPRYAQTIYDSARKYGVDYPLALALIATETGFENEYGHDRDRHGNIIWHGKTGKVLVTEQNYRLYKAFRQRTGLPQGVGPAQLTSAGYQDLADKRGGCWKSHVNIDVGLEILAGHIKALGTFNGIGAYNGGRGNPIDSYARKVLERRDFYRSKGVR